MAELPRINPAIRALEQGKPVFAPNFVVPELSIVQAINNAPYDAVCFDMEHNPYDIAAIRSCMLAMQQRRQILQANTVVPKVAPMVRIPPNGGEMNQWFAKQVLDLGAYGVVWPHVGSVEEARNAVAACRYPRPKSAPYYEPAGVRGDAPKLAVPYWGLTLEEYYPRADVWPLNPQGEILVIIMCEDLLGIKNLPRILKEVPGIGVVVIGETDLSQNLGHARDYEHPTVAAAIDEILSICKEHNVVCGHPHADAKNVEELLRKGFRWLMTGPTYSFAGLEKGLKAANRI